MVGGTSQLRLLILIAHTITLSATPAALVATAADGCLAGRLRVVHLRRRGRRLRHQHKRKCALAKLWHDHALHLATAALQTRHRNRSAVWQHL